MKVVLCGAGQVGFNIARYLSLENNDVTVIDQSPELIGKINDSLDVQAFVGHASHPDVLERAGAALKVQSDGESLTNYTSQFARFQTDAPSCDNCGSITVRNGNCYLCHNCGNSMGCS